jgi:hypothetical protein
VQGPSAVLDEVNYAESSAKVPRAIAICMPRGRALSQMAFSACLIRQVGLLRPALPRALELKPCASM